MTDDYCPICKEKYWKECDCLVKSRICPNGHEWYNCPVHNTIQIGSPIHEFKEIKCQCKRDDFVWNRRYLKAWDLYFDWNENAGQITIWIKDPDDPRGLHSESVLNILDIKVRDVKRNSGCVAQSIAFQKVEDNHIITTEYADLFSKQSGRQKPSLDEENLALKQQLTDSINRIGKLHREMNKLRDEKTKILEKIQHGQN